MSSRLEDPWTRWYEAYRNERAAIRTARRDAFERRKVANMLAGFLVAYMLVGGMAAGFAVKLVMAN